MKSNLNDNGHTKVMFKNNGETLHNLKLRHHGTHNRSDQGRPDLGWGKFNEGIQYKDLFYLHNQEPAQLKDGIILYKIKKQHLVR